MSETHQPDQEHLMKKALIEIKELRSKIKQLEHAHREPIAIIGLGCRFPAAEDPVAFWQLLANGGDAITEVPSDRWDIETYYDPEPDAPGKICTRYGGFLPQVDMFDPHFFGISEHEAIRMDPQQRLMLEVSWEALECAGIVPSTLAGSQTGVFIGIFGSDYSTNVLGQDPAALDLDAEKGRLHSLAAGRLSYLLGLHGPSLAVDAACSSSLTAVHLAVMSLRSGACDLALAGGVSVQLSPEVTIIFSRPGAMALDGRCKAYDAASDGSTRSEGCGAVVLKRLSEALADGDPILAVIRGSSVNHNGDLGGNVAQQVMIRAALRDAGVTPAEVSYVETAAKGIPLVDAIEATALGTVFQPRSEPLIVGSVKTNMGHTEAASGMAGLIKVVMALQHNAIPPHLHLRNPTPDIPWADLPLSVPTTLTPWPDGKRIAGVNSVGLAGSNAHVVVEEAPATAASSASVERTRHVLTLSAKSDAALAELAGRYAAYMSDHPSVSCADVCFSANTGRAHFSHRLSLVAESLSDFRTPLAAYAAGEPVAGLRTGQAMTAPPALAFLFSGQGAQYTGLGQRLYETQPAFQRAIDQCDAILYSSLETSLRDVLYPTANSSRCRAEGSQVDAPYAQPARFALEYALAEMWKSWGIEPQVVIGDSVGEYVAACIAGAISLEDGLKLSVARGRLMQMALTEDTVATARDAFEEVAQKVASLSPCLTLISTVTGERLQQIDAHYWVQQLHAPMRFAEGLTHVQAAGCEVMLDLGPQSILAELGRQHWPGSNDVIWLSSLGGDQEDERMQQSLSALYVRGFEINWRAVHQDNTRRKLMLPTYPFQRQRYWIEPSSKPTSLSDLPG